MEVLMEIKKLKWICYFSNLNKSFVLLQNTTTKICFAMSYRNN